MTLHTQSSDDADALGAHAFHALLPEEAQALDAFLSAHPDAQSDFAATEEAVAMLSYLVEPVAPPPYLRTRILAQVYADAVSMDESDGANRIAPPEARAPVPATAPVAPIAFAAARERRERQLLWAQAAVAAVFLMVAVGFGSWVSVLRSDVQARDRVIATQQQQITQTGISSTVAGTRPDIAARGELLRLSTTQNAVLTISGLPPLSQGKVYQVWFINGSVPAGAGLFTPEPDGSWRGVVSGDVTQAQAIAISIEPAGGSPAPTGDIVVKGSL